MTDLVERQAVIDAIHLFFTEEIEKIPTKKTEDGEVYVIHKCQPLFEMNKALCKRIKELPSVPAERTGHWIRMKAYEKWECSECNTVFRFTFKEHDYCPNCGCRMVEPQESEGQGMTEIIVKPFDWNDNFSEVAQEDFSMIQKSLSYGTASSIGMALAKLELLEKQGCKVEQESELQERLQRLRKRISDLYNTDVTYDNGDYNTMDTPTLDKVLEYFDSEVQQ